MKTAVEYLYEQIENKDVGEIPMWVYEFIEQAKEMEEKQRQQDTEYGYAQGYDDHANGRKSEKPVVLYIQQYYNETFKSE
jgi:hypothetical protein